MNNYDYLGQGKLNLQQSISTDSSSLLREHETPMNVKRRKLIEGDENLFNNYESTNKWIGKGLNDVWEVQNLKTGELEAIKEMKIVYERDYDQFKIELSFLEKIKASPHPNLISYKGYYITVDEREEKFAQSSNVTKYGYIQMEKGVTSLSNLIKKRIGNNEYFQESEVLKFIQTMLEGHIHLQKINIAHRDIKPENILLFETDKLFFKICDVGVSVRTGDNTSDTKNRTLIGTVAFLSPELFESYKAQKSQTIYNPYKSDVYSLGLVFLYFVTLKTITGVERLDKDPKYIQEKINFLIRDAKFRYRKIKGLEKTLKEMLNPNWKLRPDFLELNEFIQNINLYQLDETDEKSNENCLTDFAEIKSIEDQKQFKSISEKRPYFLKVDLSNKLITDQKLKMLTEGLAKNKFLKKLYLNFELNGLVGKKIEYLKQALIGLENLKEVDLTFWNNNLGDQGLQLLFQGISSMLELNNLSLNVSVNNLTDTGLIGIENCLVNFKNLVSLELDFAKNLINDEIGLKSLNQGLLYLEKLNTLNLNLESNKIRTRGTKIILSSLETLSDLAHLTLDLSGNEILDAGIMEISVYIKKIKTLKSFNFNAWNNNIKDKGLKEFCHSLVTHPELESLSLIIYDNLFKDEYSNYLSGEKSKEYIGEMLQKLNNLKELELNLSNNKISDVGVIAIAKSLENMVNLRKLKFFFENVGSTSESFKVLGKAVSSLKQITNLNLSFKYNNYNDGIDITAFRLYDLTFLTSLSLNFEEIQLKNEGLKCLANMITNLNLLTSLNLNLAGSEIEDMGAEALAISILTTDNISELYIDFKKNKISQIVKENLKKLFFINFKSKNDTLFDLKF